MSMKVQVGGLAWYKREDYDRLREIFSDANTLPVKYDEWLTKAEAVFNQMKRQGLTVEKIYIDPETFPEWCASHSMKPDSKARVRFANESVYRMYKDRQ